MPSSRRRASSAGAGTWTRWRGRSSASQRSPKSPRLEARPGSGSRSPATPPGSSRRRRALELPRPRRAGARASARRRPRRTVPSRSASSTARTSARWDSRSSPSAARPWAASASSSAPSPEPTSRTVPGGRDRVEALRQRGPADGAAAGRPTPEKRPDSGRYQVP